MSDTVDTFEEQVDLRAVLVRIWSGRWWVVASVILFSAAFAAVAFLTTPVYRATAVMLPAENDRSGGGALGGALGQLGGIAALAGVNVSSSNSHTEEALAVLRSREFTEQFISDRQLMPLLYPGKWDAKAGRWKGKEDEWPTLARGFKVFDEEVRTVAQDKKTGLVTVAIDWPVPAVAAEWANDLVARLNAEMRSRAIAKTNDSVGYLVKELAATTTVETREAISRLMESQINQRMFATVTREYAFRIVDRALPPDVRDVVRPKKMALLAAGPVVGFIVGIIAVWLWGALLSLLQRPVST